MQNKEKFHYIWIFFLLDDIWWYTVSWDIFISAIFSENHHIKMCYPFTSLVGHIFALCRALNGDLPMRIILNLTILRRSQILVIIFKIVRGRALTCLCRRYYHFRHVLLVRIHCTFYLVPHILTPAWKVQCVGYQVFGSSICLFFCKYI